MKRRLVGWICPIIWLGQWACRAAFFWHDLYRSGHHYVRGSRPGTADGNGELLEANDDWGNSPNRQAIIDSTIAPIDPREAAIVRSLAGNNAPYTAIVHGFNESRGIALVEVYSLD